MTVAQVETLARHTGRLVVLASALGNVAAVIFFAAGFGFVTPQRTFAQLSKADADLHAAIRAVSDTVQTHERDRQIDRADDRRAIHAVLVIECMSAKPAIRSNWRVNVDCQAVLAEDAIK